MKPAMQDLWIRLRQGLEEGVAVLWKGTSDLTLKTMAEADTFRLRMEAKKLRDRLSESYLRLGQSVFEEFERSESGGTADRGTGSFDGSISDLKFEISKLEHELRKVEEEITDLKTAHLDHPR